MLNFGKGICYSGYREGQSPLKQIYPTYNQILEDLKILEGKFDYLRMYDTSQHSQTVLRVIRDYSLNFKVMLGVEPQGEISNPNCPWGGLHSDEEIEINKEKNYQQLDQLANIANQYQDIVFALSVGNENTSDWHHNLMPADQLVNHVRYLKNIVSLPITFCEGTYAWNHHCQKLADVVDFISIHSYPLWVRKPLSEAVDLNIEDYKMTNKQYPDKQVIFTEYGWTTSSSGQMIAEDTNEESQKIYLEAIEKWAETHQVIMFLFEAFDEPWKGSNNPLEPEKHWGIYREDRTPKLAYQLRRLK
jgi:exo-beta-1,3-glucanase (GH17 family)